VWRLATLGFRPHPGVSQHSHISFMNWFNHSFLAVHDRIRLPNIQSGTVKAQTARKHDPSTLNTVAVVVSQSVSGTRRARAESRRSGKQERRSDRHTRQCSIFGQPRVDKVCQSECHQVAARRRGGRSATLSQLLSALGAQRPDDDFTYALMATNASSANLG